MSCGPGWSLSSWSASPVFHTFFFSDLASFDFHQHEHVLICWLLWWSGPRVAWSGDITSSLICGNSSDFISASSDKSLVNFCGEGLDISSGLESVLVYVWKSGLFGSCELAMVVVKLLVNESPLPIRTCCILALKQIPWFLDIACYAELNLLPCISADSEIPFCFSCVIVPGLPSVPVQFCPLFMASLAIPKLPIMLA